MKNDYEIRGDITAIFLERRTGSKLETIVSTNRLDELMGCNFKFFASWDKKTKTYYVIYHNEHGSISSLHRFLCKNPKGKVVDHWNKNTLDNTDDNLKIVSSSKNLQNRGKHTTNKTGLKGVSYNPTSHSVKKFVAQAKINRKHHFLGRYHTAEEAHQVYMDFIKQNSHFNLEANTI